MTQYEEHMNAVAGRMAAKMSKGANEIAIRLYLKRAGWIEKEIDKIIKIANRIYEKEKLQND